MKADGQAADYFISRNRFDLAEVPLRNLLASNPSDAAAAASLAMVLLRLHQRKEAVSQAREAVRLRPEYSYAHYILARALVSCNEYDDALVHALEAIRLRPNFGHYRLIICQMYIRIDRFAEAIIEAERGLALAPDDIDLKRSRAMALAGAGRAEEAKLAIAEVLRVKPGAQAHAIAGHVHRLLSEFDTAETYFRRSLELDANLTSSFLGLGLVRFALGKWEEARAFLDEGDRSSKGETDPEVCNAMAALAAIQVPVCGSAPHRSTAPAITSSALERNP